jgi:hypothetical protein
MIMAPWKAVNTVIASPDVNYDGTAWPDLLYSARDVLDAPDGCHYGDYRDANSHSANSRIRRHPHVMT